MRLLFILLLALSHHVLQISRAWVETAKTSSAAPKDWSYASQPSGNPPSSSHLKKKSKSKKK